ncbi:SIS domain-containing protein [bacterium]|nr:SIS domain-containing protein [bacterium]
MTVFIDEVNAQPRALRRLADFYSSVGAARLAAWHGLAGSSRELTFIGMGTSEHAAWLVHDRLAAAGPHPLILDAGEFLHYQLESFPRQGLFVLLSQSGESVETKQVTLALPRERTVVLTNSETSSMARAAGLCLPLLADPERSITNQTYLNTLGLLYLMAGGATGRLHTVADSLEPGLDPGRVSAAAEFIQPADCLHVIARGPSLAAARQLGLTLMEGARCKAAAFAAGAFRHGPFEVAGPGHQAIVMAARGRTESLCLGLAAELAAKGSRVLLLTDCESTPAGPNLFELRVPYHGEEHLFPLALAMVQAHLLDNIARLRGYEAGVFHSISKVTTKE